MIGNSNDKANFLHKLLLTNRQVANLGKAFANNSSADTELSKTQLSKTIQSGGFLGIDPLLKTRLPLVKNVIKPLGISVLIPLRFTAAASAADAGIHKKILGCGHPLDSALHTTILIISNDEMDDIMKIVKSLEDSGLLLKGVSGTIQKGAKEQKRRFFSLLFGTLGASLLRNMLAGK